MDLFKGRKTEDQRKYDHLEVVTSLRRKVSNKNSALSNTSVQTFFFIFFKLVKSMDRLWL